MPPHVLDPACKRLRTVKPEDVTTRRLRIERVSEPCLGSSGLVHKRERAFERGRNVFRYAVDVLCRLPGDARQRLAFLLGLECSDRCAVDEEEVVGATV